MPSLQEVRVAVAPPFLALSCASLSDLAIPSHPPLALSKLPTHCTRCNQPNSTMKICTGCKLTPYCSEACQKQDWKRHKRECAEMEVLPKKKSTGGKKEGGKKEREKGKLSLAEILAMAMAEEVGSREAGTFLGVGRLTRRLPHFFPLECPRPVRPVLNRHSTNRTLPRSPRPDTKISVGLDTKPSWTLLIRH